MTRQVKILIDICMVILLVLLFLTEDILSVHIFLGYVLIPIIIIHLLLNGKWLVNSTKKLFRGKMTPKSLYMYVLFVGLTIAFAVCIISGIAIVEFSAKHLCDLHEISAYACVILVILHVQVHWRYLKSFLPGKAK